MAIWSGLGSFGSAAGATAAAAVVVVGGVLGFQALNKEDPAPDAPTVEAPETAGTPDTPDTEPAAVVEDAGPTPPSFDVVRVDADGTTLIAGRAEPGSSVAVLLDGTEVHRADTDGGGSFAAFFFIEPATTPRIVSLSMEAGAEPAVKSNATVIISPSVAEPEPTAVAAVETPASVDPNGANTASASTESDAAPEAVEVAALQEPDAELPVESGTPAGKPEVAEDVSKPAEASGSTSANAPATTTDPSVENATSGDEVPVQTVDATPEAGDPPAETAVIASNTTDETPNTETTATAETTAGAETVLASKDAPGSEPTQPVEDKTQVAVLETLIVKPSVESVPAVDTSKPTVADGEASETAASPETTQSDSPSDVDIADPVIPKEAPVQDSTNSNTEVETASVETIEPTLEIGLITTETPQEPVVEASVQSEPATDLPDPVNIVASDDPETRAANATPDETPVSTELAESPKVGTTTETAEIAASTKTTDPALPLVNSPEVAAKEIDTTRPMEGAQSASTGSESTSIAPDPEQPASPNVAVAVNETDPTQPETAPVLEQSNITIGDSPSLGTPSTGFGSTPALTASLDATTSTPSTPTAPSVLLADDTGIRVLQNGGNAPSVTQTVIIDTISYDHAGEVALGGRGSGSGFVRVYLNNKPIKTTKIGIDGQWKTPLPEVDTGVYTLRVDEINEAGAVTSRMETPFKREEPEVLAALDTRSDEAKDDTGVMTVQPGHSLWKIARERYGQGELYVKLYRANRSRIRNPDLIYPGQVFEIPEIEPRP